MTDVYVIRNQQGHYWGKGKVWADGYDPRAVMRLRHEDAAINTLFELSSADFELRGEILAVAVSERGEPVIEPSDIPIPVVPDEADEADADAETELAGSPSPTTTEADAEAPIEADTEADIDTETNTKKLDLG